jgi:DNA-dependent RNA polymerase auxiliary subunit epsilon
MTEKVQYFEEATTRLRSWIHEDKQRTDDFFNMLDVKDEETIREYLARNAYRVNIFQDVIDALIQIEKDRVTKRICQV